MERLRPFAWAVLLLILHIMAQIVLAVRVVMSRKSTSPYDSGWDTAICRTFHVPPTSKVRKRA
jgi:predicted permease